MTGKLSIKQAAVRRFLLEKQGLQAHPSTMSGSRKPDVLEALTTLECVQLDPVAAVERNQHLVLAARMPGYEPRMLEKLLEERRVFEYWANAACVIPMTDYPIFEVVRKRFQHQLQSELDKMGSVVQAVRKRLELDGPLPSKAFTTTDRVHGYWDNTHAKTKATSHVLNLLNDMGLIQVVRREGTTRYFDLTERSVPSVLLDEAKQIHLTEARTKLIDKYLRAYRVFRGVDARFGWQRMTAAQRRQEIDERVARGLLIKLDIENVREPYYILAEDEDHLRACMDDSTSDSRREIRFLAPLDNLMWHRDRIEDLFGFSYTWEVYTPIAKRRYGYYAMPILDGEIVIGRLDPRLDRTEKKLNVSLLQLEENVRLTKSLQTRLLRALNQFSKFHGATLGTVLRTEPDGLHL